MSDSKICNIVVLISGSGSNLQAIIDDLAGHPNARICAGVSNRADAYGLVRAQKVGIAQHVLNHKDFADRLAFDTALMQVIDQHQPGFHGHLAVDVAEDHAQFDATSVVGIVG